MTLLVGFPKSEGGSGPFALCIGIGLLSASRRLCESPGYRSRMRTVSRLAQTKRFRAISTSQHFLHAADTTYSAFHYCQTIYEIAIPPATHVYGRERTRSDGVPIQSEPTKW